MAKEWAKWFYKSKEWLECRAAYILSVHGLCERCLSKRKYKPGHIVHHIIHLTPGNINNPEITLSWDNLEYVCLGCHNEEHGVGKAEDVTREGLRFNEFGDLLPDYPP